MHLGPCLVSCFLKVFSVMKSVLMKGIPCCLIQRVLHCVETGLVALADLVKLCLLSFSFYMVSPASTFVLQSYMCRGIPFQPSVSFLIKSKLIIPISQNLRRVPLCLLCFMSGFMVLSPDCSLTSHFYLMSS